MFTKEELEMMRQDWEDQGFTEAEIDQNFVDLGLVQPDKIAGEILDTQGHIDWMKDFSRMFGGIS